MRQEPNTDVKISQNAAAGHLAKVPDFIAGWRYEQDTVLNYEPKASDFEDRVALQLIASGYNTYQNSFCGRIH